MKKILLVDDTKTVLMLEQMILKVEGYTLLVAHDGLEALEMVGTDRPDLILLDIVMPGIDGIETCLRLKKNQETRGIPIIMVTTRGEEHLVAKAKKAGCNDYVLKPINKMELLTKVQAFLDEKE